MKLRHHRQGRDSSERELLREAVSWLDEMAQELRKQRASIDARLLSIERRKASLTSRMKDGRG